MVSCSCCLNAFIDLALHILFKIKEVLLFVLDFVDGLTKEIGKRSQMFLLNITVSKLLSTKELVRICSIAVVAFLVTVLGLFMINTMPFLSMMFRVWV